jgi:hypothetical protein
VIVLWSKVSVASDWVRAEAEVARVARTAVPVLIDEVSVDDLPMVFRALHTVDLRRWNGDPAAAGFRDILSAVAKLGAVAGSPRPATSSHYPQSAVPRRRWPIVAGLAALVLALGAAGLAWWMLRPQVTTCDSPQQIAVSEVPLTLCLRGSWAPTGATPFQYDSADGKVQFRIVAQPDEIALPTFRDAIVQNAQRIAGDPAKIAVVKEGTMGVDGEAWRFIEFTNAGQAAFADYYYSSPGFGAVQLLFVSSVADVAIRNGLATPILNSVDDTRR